MACLHMAQENPKFACGSPKVNIRLLCIHPELGETFLQSVCSDATGTNGDTVVENRAVHLDVLAGDPQMIPGWGETMKKSDAVALLVRFLDVITLDKIRSIYRSLPNDRALPLSIILFREEGEIAPRPEAVQNRYCFRAGLQVER